MLITGESRCGYTGTLYSHNISYKSKTVLKQNVNFKRSMHDMATEMSLMTKGWLCKGGDIHAMKYYTVLEKDSWSSARAKRGQTLMSAGKEEK